MKILHEYRATYVLQVIWEAKFNSDIHFIIGREEMSISGQTRSKEVKFTNSFFYQHKPILCSFVSEFQKCYLFLRTTNSNVKNFISKVTSSLLPVFYHCTAKNKDLALKFCMCVVCMQWGVSYSYFFHGTKMLGWAFLGVIIRR